MTEPYAQRGVAYYALGGNQMARSSCEMKLDNRESSFCLALTFEKRGQRVESDAQITWLSQFAGSALAYQYAQIYAQRGERDTALKWLDTALRLRDLAPSQDRSLHGSFAKEPRFQAIEREVKFPD